MLGYRAYGLSWAAEVVAGRQYIQSSTSLGSPKTKSSWVLPSPLLAVEQCAKASGLSNLWHVGVRGELQR